MSKFENIHNFLIFFILKFKFITNDDGFKKIYITIAIIIFGLFPPIENKNLGLTQIITLQRTNPFLQNSLPIIMQSKNFTTTDPCLAHFNVTIPIKFVVSGPGPPLKWPKVII